jgi:hypothetical protein
MERTERKQRGGERRTYRAPWVQVVGAVLTEAGFAVGDELAARAEKGRVVIERERRKKRA